MLLSEDVDLGRTPWTDAYQLLQSAHLCWRDMTLSREWDDMGCWPPTKLLPPPPLPSSTRRHGRLK